MHSEPPSFIPCQPKLGDETLLGTENQNPAIISTIYGHFRNNYKI